MQEIPGENAGEIGQQHLRFVRRGVYCCSAVARESSLNAVALLGRFLPRLGPPPQGERPLSFPAQIFLSAIGPAVARAIRSAAIPPPLPDRGAIPRAESQRADRPGSRTRRLTERTTPRVGSGARPCKARD